MKTFIRIVLSVLFFAWLLSKCGGADEQSVSDANVTDNFDSSPEATQARILAAEKEKIDNEALRKQEEIDEKLFLKSKAGKIWKKHPEWSKDECERLSKGKIWIGMSLDMLKYKRGLPNHANPSNYGNGTQWQWCWDDWTPSCFYDNNDDGKIDSYN